MYKYARNSKGEIVCDFAGNPFIFSMREDADGFMRHILGYSFDEYSIHYHVSLSNATSHPLSVELIEKERKSA